MSKTDAFETDLLNFIFDDIAIPWEATTTDFYISLHSADPGEAGNQTTNEISYTGYARVAVSRTTGWTISGNNASNAAAITFGTRSDVGSVTATHFGVGTASSGTGNLVYKGALDSSLAISQNVTPEFAIGDLDVNED